MTRFDDLPADFDGCARSCRKTRSHTLLWGDCAHAPESARPEPLVTIGGVQSAADGHPSIVLRSVPVSELAERIEKALRSVQITLGPKSLALLEDGHQMHLTGGEYSAMALAVAMDLAEGGAS
ncbi:hypothetical protein KCMC57_64940 (plasmid) [Kitasatospora sp. CMC57]|uniref:Uncharacterized protein n=1 Tax=Kitasatospora sp. CMC57 TaxID=3231513 RepID=A0AB33K8A6_9ACTN